VYQEAEIRWDGEEGVAGQNRTLDSGGHRRWRNSLAKREKGLKTSVFHGNYTGRKRRER